MEEYKGVVKNITHNIVVDGITYTTPAYDVEYTCYFNDEATFHCLMCNKHDGVNIIPHKYTDGGMCTGKDFKKIINEAYPNKELIHLVCERFFRQYNESDKWGTQRVLKMCGFELYYTCVNENDFKQVLKRCDYYFFRCGYPILKLTHDCKDKLIGRHAFFIKRKQQ